jgi:hypothetical protein
MSKLEVILFRKNKFQARLMEKCDAYLFPHQLLKIKLLFIFIKNKFQMVSQNN